jgi:two-component system sensor histidine kinase YesM
MNPKIQPHRRSASPSAGTTISSRLLICFLASTLIPSILITSLLYLRFNNNYRTTALDQMWVSHDLIGEYVNRYFRELDTITTAPYYHSYFSSAQSLEEDDPEYLSKANSFQSEMQSLLNLTTYSHSDISDFIIWSDSQYLYYSLYNELWYFSNRIIAEEQPWYTHAMAGNGKTVFTPIAPMPDPAETPEAAIDTTAFYVARKINNLRQPEQTSLILLNMSSRAFDEHLRSMELLYDSFVAITNECDELIYSSKPLTAGTLREVLSGSDFQYGGNNWSCISADLEDFPLTVHVAYSLDDISREAASLIVHAVIIYALCMLLALCLFVAFNRWISHSAGMLLTTFSELETGNLEVRCPPVAVREFNQIGTSVNDMIVRLNERIKNEYLLTIRQKSLQLHALRSQIQPHFLINTIYGFIALNQIGETKKLDAGFYSLARLLRYVLSKQYSTTIGQERDFLEDYLKLQQLRFGERLSYQLDCPEDLRSVQIPRLLLQPLVENAVIHGIEPCEHPCLCRVAVFRQEDRLHILVEDNGVGADPEEVRKKSADAARTDFQPPDEDSKMSIGLHYVKQRLNMWSENAVMNLTFSETTRAEIQIPWEEVHDEAVNR